MKVTKNITSEFASDRPIEVKSPVKSPAATAVEARAAANKASTNLDVFRFARSFSNPLMPSATNLSVASILAGPAAIQKPGDAGLSPTQQDPLQNSISARHGAVSDLFVGGDGLAGLVVPQSTSGRSINPNAADDGESGDEPGSAGSHSGSEEGNGKGVVDFVTHVVTDFVADVVGKVVGEFVGPVITIVEGAEIGAEGVTNTVDYFKNLDEKTKDNPDPPVEPTEPTNVTPPPPEDDDPPKTDEPPKTDDPPETEDPPKTDDPDDSNYVSDPEGSGFVTPVFGGTQSGGASIGIPVDQTTFKRAAAPYDPSRDVPAGPSVTPEGPGTQEYKVAVDFTSATVNRVTGPYDPHRNPSTQDGPAGERPDPRTQQ